MADDPLHLRPGAPGDEPAVRELALLTGLFTDDDVDGVLGVLTEHLQGRRPDDAWVLAVRGERVLGAGYWAPEPFGDRVWNLCFLAVHPQAQHGGVGTLITDHVLRELEAAGEDAARVLLVETSSTPAYQGARGFYAARGFDREARIREFYGPGDDKLVFWRRVGAPPS